MSDVLKIHNDGHVRTIQLNRPERKNALNDALAWGIVNAVEDASKDDEVWILAITGTGDAFCSGLDLAGSGAEGESASRLSPQSKYLDDLSWVSRFPINLRYGCDKPIVAGINGVAVGAGLSLAMSCDIRIMSRSARLMAGYPRIGGSPDGGLTWTLAQAMNYEQALRFLLENRTVQGDEAKALNLVGEVVDDDKFDARFHEYCQSLTKLSPITGRLSKRGVAAGTKDIDVEAKCATNSKISVVPSAAATARKPVPPSWRSVRPCLKGGSHCGADSVLALAG